MRKKKIERKYKWVRVKYKGMNKGWISDGYQ